MEISQAWGPQNVSIVSGRGDGLCSSRRKMKWQNPRFVPSWMRRLWTSKGSRHHSMRNFMRPQQGAQKVLHQLGLQRALLHLWILLLQNNKRTAPANHWAVSVEGQLESEAAKRVRRAWVLGAPMELEHLLPLSIVPFFWKFRQQGWMNRKVLLMIHSNHYQALVWVLVSVKGSGMRSLSRSLEWSERRNGNNWLNRALQCLHPTPRAFNDLAVVWLLLPKFSSFISMWGSDLILYSVVFPQF